jgi:PAS domain S-box-containing protein
VLRDREQRFRDLVESSDGIVWEADAQTFGFISVSENAERMLGYPAQDWMQSGFWASHIHPEDRDQATTHCAACTGRLEDHDFEYRFIAKDGRVVWLRDIVRVVAVNGQPRWLRGLMIDITRHKQVESDLHAALLDKTALLKEVHHRVKNNLQVVTSLLRLEAARADPDACNTKVVLGEMQGRIRSMALLHESLYRSNSFAQVDLGAYLKQLSLQAFRASADSGAVRLEHDMVQVSVSLDQATPAGLLVNELISNSLKHAFPQGRSGVVRVTLQPTPDGRWCLQVSDDGIGLPGDFAARRTQSLGLQLVDDLAQQMQGNLQVESAIGASGGSSFRVIFSSQICL